MANVLWMDGLRQLVVCYAMFLLALAVAKCWRQPNPEQQLWFVFTLLSIAIPSSSFLHDPSMIHGIAATMGLITMILDNTAWPALLKAWLGIWSNSTNAMIYSRALDIAVHLILPVAFSSRCMPAIQPWMGLVCFSMLRVECFIQTRRWFASRDDSFSFQPTRSSHFWSNFYILEVSLAIFVPLACYEIHNRTKIVLQTLVYTSCVVIGFKIARWYLLPMLRSHAKKRMCWLLEQADIRIGQDLIVYEDSFWLDWLTKGMLAVGESYMTKQWDCNESVALDDFISRLLTLPQQPRQVLFRSWDARTVALLARLLRYPSSSYRYLVGIPLTDQFCLGPSFYQAFMDSSIHPGFAIWTRQHHEQDQERELERELDREQEQIEGRTFHACRNALEQAQNRKLAWIATKLRLKEGMRVLDLCQGSYGGLGHYLHETYKVNVVTVVENEKELAFARENFSGRKMGSSHDFVLASYEQLPEFKVCFDRVVSVGITRRLSRDQMAAFFQQLKDCCSHSTSFSCSREKTRDEPLLLVETLCSSRPLSIGRSQEWATAYINGAFPAVLPTIEELLSILEPHTVQGKPNTRCRWIALEQETHNEDYGRTLLAWSGSLRACTQNCGSHRITTTRLNFPDSFQRTYNFYLRHVAASLRVNGLTCHSVVLKLGNSTTAPDRAHPE